MTGKILMVEDDEDIRMLVTTHLKRAGHSVRAAASGAEAVSACTASGAPDLFVLDVGLPDTEGFDLLVRLRSLPGCDQVPAVFLTARVQERDIERGRALGAEYLTKPFVAKALLERVEESLRPVGSSW